MVAVNLWYDVGSKHEKAGRTGFAHLFEHMMFQGSANVAKGDHFSLVACGRRHAERQHLAGSDELLRDRSRATSSAWRCGSRPIAWRACSRP